MPDLEVQADLQVEDGASSRPLNVEDFSPEQIAAIRTAAEAILAAMPPGTDLSTVEASLASILTAIPAGTDLSTVEARLQAIADNTDGLELSLSGLDLDTQAITTAITNLISEVSDDLTSGDLTGLATQSTLADVLAALVGTLSIGGTVTVANPTADPETGLATSAKQDSAKTTLDYRFNGGKSAVTATVTSSGDTTVLTPASGKKITLYWVSAINDPDESTTPLIKISLGATEVYRGYALAHWEPFTGATDAALVVNLGNAASVALTAHYTEAP